MSARNAQLGRDIIAAEGLIIGGFSCSAGQK
jgi:hypothetical protein